MHYAHYLCLVHVLCLYRYTGTIDQHAANAMTFFCFLFVAVLMDSCTVNSQQTSFGIDNILTGIGSTPPGSIYPFTSPSYSNQLDLLPLVSTRYSAHMLMSHFRAIPMDTVRSKVNMTTVTRREVGITTCLSITIYSVCYRVSEQCRRR